MLVAYVTYETELGPHLFTRIWIRAMISLLKKAIIDLPINMKGNSKHTSIDSSSPLVAQNKNIARCFADVNNRG